MGIDIVSRKFWNQLRNGKTFGSNTSDFTDYLLGTICEKIKVETTIDVWWKSNHAPYYDTFSKGTVGAVVSIVRMINSFVEDEFRVGDTIYYDAWFTPTGGSSTHYTGTGTIQAVSDLQMDLTSFTGGLPDTSTGNVDSMTIWGTTSLTAILMKYNFTENNEANNFISKVDGNTMCMAGSGLTATDTTLLPQGVFKGWQDDGNIKVKTGSSGLSYKQRFIITQELWVTPFYLPAQYNDLIDGIAPSYLKDVASLRYIANYELRQSLYNPNIAHGGTDSVMYGDVCWFDEHFNGFNPIEFTKYSISYNNGVYSQVHVVGTTSVKMEISSLNNLFSNGNTNFIVNFFMLPIEDSEIKNTSTTMFENYLFDQCFQTIGSSYQDGIKGIIKNVIGTIVSNRLHIELEIAFTPAQRALFQDHQYIISVITDDHTQTHATSKRVHVLMDYNDAYASADNSDLLVTKRPEVKFWEHPFDPSIPLTGTKNYRGWITDGIYSEFPFEVDGILNLAKIKVIAYNSSTLEYFELMNYNMDLTPYPVISGERIVNISTTRGFKLITGSLRNLVSLTRTSSFNYLLKFAFKLRFEDWIQLLTAHQDFYNSALTNNGLSQKWSNYFDTATNWSLKIIHELLIEDPATNLETTFNVISELDCHNYDEDGNTPPLWSGSLETFDGTTSLGTDNNAGYSTSSDTKVVVTATSLNALTGAAMYGIIYVGGYNLDGIYTQWQLSTKELPASDNWLKPLTGETKCKLTVIDSHHVKLEGMIDYTKVQGDISIYARIGYDCQDIAEIRASNSVTRSMLYTSFILTRFYDITIDGVPVSIGGSVPSPYALQDVLDALETDSGGYEFAVVPVLYFSGTATCTAPVGTGSSANGKVIELTLYNSSHSPLLTVTFTLSGGVDEYVCPGFVTVTERLLTELNESLKQENDDYINLDK